MTVAERIADHVVGTRFEDLPTAAVERAKDLLVWHLAVAFAGRFTPHGRAAIALAHQLSAGGGVSTILGERKPATMLDAVYAHVELIDPNTDARHLHSKTNPGRVTDPVGWILGQREHSSGKELIAAVVLAYDASCKLAEPQLKAGDYSRVPHKCAFAPFSVAAVAARLLGADRDRAAVAIGRAAHFGMGLNEGLGDSGAFSAIARSALVAALVREPGGSALRSAIEGANGLYAALFDGPPAGLERSLEGLGREFSILSASTQRYPGSASHLAALEATRTLVEQSGAAAERISHLVATLPDELEGRFAYQESRMDRAKTAADREAAAAGSLQGKLALLVVGGVVVPRPTLAQFEDARVQRLFPRVQLTFANIPVDEARVEATLTDGTTRCAEWRLVPEPKGDWSAWLRKDGERFLSRTQLASLERQLTNLEDVGDVGDVLACTVPSS